MVRHASTLRLLLMIATGILATHVAAQPAADRVSVFAAGSLRAALGEAAREFETARPGAPIAFTFGASGLLKDRLLAGEKADVFASANMEHPEALHRAGKSAPVYGSLEAQGSADIFITYCTNATLASREEPALRTVAVPEAFDVSADYGVTLLVGSSARAREFVDFVLGAQGQRILASHGFAPR
ncbi:MAG: substrate-binding domain-containing protein [Caldimonas sp.]